MKQCDMCQAALGDNRMNCDCCASYHRAEECYAGHYIGTEPKSCKMCKSRLKNMRKKRIRAEREGNRAIVRSFLPTKRPDLRYEQSLRLKIVASDSDPAVYFEHGTKLWVLVVNSTKAPWSVQADLCKLCFDLDVVLAKTHPGEIVKSLHTIVLHDYLYDRGWYDAAEELMALVKHYTIRKCKEHITNEVFVPMEKIHGSMTTNTSYCDLIACERWGDVTQCDLLYYGPDAMELIQKACVIEHEGKPAIKLEL